MSTIPFSVVVATASVVFIAGCAADPPRAQHKAAATDRDPTCLTDTGSRLPVTGANCREVGRSYTNDDLMRTGSTSVGDALQLLDPSISVHR